jgi:hypothetical protein
MIDKLDPAEPLDVVIGRLNEVIGLLNAIASGQSRNVAGEEGKMPLWDEDDPVSAPASAATE